MRKQWHFASFKKPTISLFVRPIHRLSPTASKRQAQDGKGNILNGSIVDVMAVIHQMTLILFPYSF